MRKHRAGTPTMSQLRLSRASEVSGLNPLQNELFQLSSEESSTKLNRWQQYHDRVAKQIVAKDTKARKRIEVLVVSAQASGITWMNLRKLLEQPVGCYQPSDLDVQPDTDTTSEKLVENPAEEKIVWTDQAMLELHEGVLLYSLQLLRSKGNAKEKLAILQWIWSKDVRGFEVIQRNGSNQKVPIRADQLPFTYQTCCRLSGYHSDELREGLAWAMRSAFDKWGFQPRK